MALGSYVIRMEKSCYLQQEEHLHAVPLMKYK